MLGPIRTRDIKTTLAMFYVQYGVKYEVIRMSEIDGWSEIYVKPISE